MKFRVSSGEFAKVLSKIVTVVPAKSTLPILESFHLALTKSALSITGTDLEVAMTVTMPVEGSKPGQLCIPAKRLAEIVRVLPNETITLEASTETKRVTISSTNGEYKLTCESAEEFPSLAQITGDGNGAQLEVPLAALKHIIGTTLFAVSTDELRPAMMGVLMTMKKGQVSAVATDGHRLVQFSTKEFGGDANASVVIPSKTLSLVSRSFEGANIAMTLGTAHVQFAQENTMITSRVIDEQYPNYESVIPLDNEKKMIVARKPLLDSVRRVMLFSNSLTRQTRLKLSAGVLRVSAEDVDAGGEAREDIPCTYGAGDLEIGFNGKFVDDALSHLDSDDVEFAFSSPTRACIISPIGGDERHSTLMLVMPVRLNA